MNTQQILAVLERTTPPIDSKLVIRKWTDINVAIFSGTKGADYCATVDDFMKQYTNQMPDTVTYRKNKETGYYDVYGYNRPIGETK